MPTEREQLRLLPAQELPLDDAWTGYALARDVAPKIDLHPAAARRYLRSSSLNGGGPTKTRRSAASSRLGRRADNRNVSAIYLRHRRPGLQPHRRASPPLCEGKRCI